MHDARGLPCFQQLACCQAGAARALSERAAHHPHTGAAGPSLPQAANGTSNPLAGLRNLVSALAGGDADATERGAALGGVLSALSSGTKAAPTAEVVGVVARMLAATNTDSGAVAALLLKEAVVISKLRAPDNVTHLVRRAGAGKVRASGTRQLA